MILTLIIWLEKQKIQKDDLVSELVSIRDNLEKKQVVVKADKSVKSHEVMDIMNAAKEPENDKLVLAGEPLSKKEQRELKNKNLEKIEELDKESIKTQDNNWVE